MTQPLSQRVQDAVRDALATTTRNPDASLDTTAAFIASAVLAEVHRQPAAAAVAPLTNQTTAEAALDAARATNQRLNREKQRLESELATYRKAVTQWEISEHSTYVPLRSLAAIAKAAGVDVPDRYEAHYERVERAEAELRRMADETATETQARRGDAFEQWLKARRDEWAPEGCQPWQILDQTLEEYRLHADTGTPLGEHVCEGKAVGDCECLEQPAAGARQDGTQP